jgi:hypothetical protein
VAEPEHELDLGALHEQLAALDVMDLLLSSASTIASIAYAKLEHDELDQARTAIDALGSLLPHLRGEAAGDLGRVLVELQVAYAGATG